VYVAGADVVHGPAKVFAPVMVSAPPPWFDMPGHVLPPPAKVFALAEVILMLVPVSVPDTVNPVDVEQLKAVAPEPDTLIDPDVPKLSVRVLLLLVSNDGVVSEYVLRLSVPFTNETVLLTFVFLVIAQAPPTPSKIT
jgi:hypothetical protein